MSRKIQIDECTEIGYVHKTHGLGGDVLVKFLPLYLPTIEEKDQFFLLIDGALVPYFVEDDQVKFRSGETANIKFLWIDTNDQAKEIVAKKIFVFTDELIVDEEVFDSEALVGYHLVDSTKGDVGPIVEINDYSGNMVVTIEFNGDEVMVPLADEILTNINHELRTISVNAPDGIFDLNE